jgi:hypothetical protein
MNTENEEKLTALLPSYYSYDTPTLKNGYKKHAERQESFITVTIAAMAVVTAVKHNLFRFFCGCTHSGIRWSARSAIQMSVRVKR